VAAETAGGRTGKPGRPAGKKLAEGRQGFLIYLPVSLHARLRMEAAKRSVSMSELVSSAVAQFLVGGEQSPLAPAPVAPEPFVGRLATPAPVAPEPRAPSGQPAQPDAPITYEVE